jgi:hypothetical protein
MRPWSRSATPLCRCGISEEEPRNARGLVP